MIVLEGPKADSSFEYVESKPAKNKRQARLREAAADHAFVDHIDCGLADCSRYKVAQPRTDLTLNSRRWPGRPAFLRGVWECGNRKYEVL